jgi:hypothetical protein
MDFDVTAIRDKPNKRSENDIAKSTKTIQKNNRQESYCGLPKTALTNTISGSGLQNLAIDIRRNMSQPTSESRVQVGIRIRPLTAKEINQGGKNSLVVTPPSIKIAQRPFTYDTVFDTTVGQAELYDSVATPLLQGFADGYNATVRKVNFFDLVSSISICI